MMCGHCGNGLEYDWKARQGPWWTCYYPAPPHQINTPRGTDYGIDDDDDDDDTRQRL